MEGCILDNNTCVPFEAGSCAPCCEQLGGNSSSSSADGSGGSGSGGAEAQLEDCTWEDWFNDGERSSPTALVHALSVYALVSVCGQGDAARVWF